MTLNGRHQEREKAESLEQVARDGESARGAVGYSEDAARLGYASVE